MDKLFLEMDIGNQNELLKIYESNLKNAADDKVKATYTDKIAKTKEEISKLEAQEKAM